MRLVTSFTIYTNNDYVKIILNLKQIQLIFQAIKLLKVRKMFLKRYLQMGM